MRMPRPREVRPRGARQPQWGARRGCLGVSVAAALAASLLALLRCGTAVGGPAAFSRIALRGTAAPVAAPLLPPVLVVNLDKSKARWERCQEEFAKQGVVAERFPATLGKAMSFDELSEKTTFGARYFCTPGMIGCFMSHLRIWNKTVQENIPAVVVLEDDIVLYPNFTQRLRTLLQELPADWDICLLGAVGCIATDVEAWYMKLYALITGGGRASPGKTRGISENVYVPYRPAGTHAYMVSQKGAQALLKMCPQPRYHVDITAWSQPGLRLYAAKEFLATQQFGDDTTVSKEGAPLTKRFLRWCWDLTGLSMMGRRGGLPNLTWAWTIACFAVPIPFTNRRRLIVEMGPASSMFVILLLLCIPLRSAKPAGVAIAYLASIIWMVRWLVGTSKLPVVALYLIAGGFLFLP